MAWQLDTAHSLIEFSVKHLMVTTVKGRFNKHEGALELDQANPTNSTADITIDAASIDTGDANRDGHLRSADFFDVAQFPTITFKSTRIEAVGGDNYRIIGNLTMHGVTKEITLDATHEGTTRNMRSQRVTAFTIKGAINRKDFGLEWNVALESGGMLVSEQVKINVEAQAVEVAEPVAAAEAAN